MKHDAANSLPEAFGGRNSISPLTVWPAPKLLRAFTDLVAIAEIATGL